MNQRTATVAQGGRYMKWYDSGPVWFLGCTLCGLLAYFIGELGIPSTVHLSLMLTFSAAIVVYSATDFKRKFPDCNSKIGYAILFVLFTLAYAMAQITL